MDFRLRRQNLLERAAQVEEEANRVKNAQAQGLMRALALLYSEMAEELEDSGLFERRFSVNQACISTGKRESMTN